MKIIDLELHHYNLFCPAPREQILEEESFNPSNAQLFCYVEGEGVFEYIHG
jgi:hypothetical protein